MIVIIHDVVQDSMGIMWFASSKGIIRYDGVEWKLMGKKDGFQEVSIRRLKLDRFNRIWALPDFMSDSIFYFTSKAISHLPARQL